MGMTSNGCNSRAVAAKTADYTVVANTDNGKTFTTAGATGTVVFSLPAATVGQWYQFVNKADTYELRIDPNGSEVMALPSTGALQTAGSYLTANAIGESVQIQCVVAGVWDVVAYTGTWTAV